MAGPAFDASAQYLPYIGSMQCSFERDPRRVRRKTPRRAWIMATSFAPSPMARLRERVRAISRCAAPAARAAQRQGVQQRCCGCGAAASSA